MKPQPHESETPRASEPGVAAPTWAKALLVAAPFAVASLLFLAFVYLRG